MPRLSFTHVHSLLWKKRNFVGKTTGKYLSSKKKNTTKPHSLVPSLIQWAPSSTKVIHYSCTNSSTKNKHHKTVKQTSTEGVLFRINTKRQQGADHKSEDNSLPKRGSSPKKNTSNASGNYFMVAWSEHPSTKRDTNFFFFCPVNWLYVAHKQTRGTTKRPFITITSPINKKRVMRWNGRGGVLISASLNVCENSKVNLKRKSLLAEQINKREDAARRLFVCLRFVCLSEFLCVRGLGVFM